MMAAMNTLVLTGLVRGVRTRRALVLENLAASLSGHLLDSPLDCRSDGRAWPRWETRGNRAIWLS